MSLFDKLKIGSEVMSRESETDSRWELLRVTKIDGLDVTFEDGDGNEIYSNKEEVDEGIYFKEVNK